MPLELSVAHVERFVVDEQAHELAVGDVDNGLAGLGVAVARLGIWQGTQLEHRVEICPGQGVRLTLVEIAPQPDVSVGQREQRLGLGEGGEVECRLA